MNGRPAMPEAEKGKDRERNAVTALPIVPERITIPVTGMTCAACQSFIQRTLSGQAGVRDASVNLMLNNATVTFDPTITSISALVDTIRTTGYGAETPALHTSVLAEQEEHDREQWQEYKQLRLRAIVSLAAGLGAMLLSMPLMSSGNVGGMDRMNDPLMNWNMRVLDPVLRRVLPWMYQMNANAIRWLLFALAAVILGWAGRRFYTRAGSALRH